MTRRSSAIEQAAREGRASAIRRCRRCDPCGWKLGPDHTPVEPAVRCDHRPPPPARDITEPLHEPDLFTDTEE